jgi:hypothetical protein
MQQDPRAEISASIGAHQDLGPGYDAAIAEGLVERIGEEIDRRVDAHLRSGLGAPAAPVRAPAAAAPAAAPVPSRAGGGVASVFMSLGSIALGLGATAITTALGKDGKSQVLMVLLIWAAIAIVNFTHTRRRG